jgi:hypothetical protein
MKALRRLLFLLVITAQSPIGFARAHHATATQFDTSQTIKLKGTIAKLDWGNPHVHLSMEVKAERGVVQHWNVELGSPGAIIVAGLSKDALKPGTSLTFDAYPGKANAASTRDFSACATQITLADGTTASFVVGI